MKIKTILLLIITITVAVYKPHYNTRDRDVPRGDTVRIDYVVTASERKKSSTTTTTTTCYEWAAAPAGRRRTARKGPDDKHNAPDFHNFIVIHRDRDRVSQRSVRPSASRGGGEGGHFIPRYKTSAAAMLQICYNRKYAGLPVLLEAKTI